MRSRSKSRREAFQSLLVRAGRPFLARLFAFERTDSEKSQRKRQTNAGMQKAQNKSPTHSIAANSRKPPRIQQTNGAGERKKAQINSRAAQTAHQFPGPVPIRQGEGEGYVKFPKQPHPRT
jgi:hypothetical protein